MNLLLVIVLGICCVVWIPHIVLNYILFLPTYIQVLVHVPLAIVYALWIPSEWKAFKTWPGWSYIRDDYLHITFHGPGKYIVNQRTHANDMDGEDGDNNNNNTKRAYCFGVHPHGVYATSLMFGFALEPRMQQNHGVRVFGTSLLFRIPLVKELIGWGGTVQANRENVLFEMQAGNSVALAPGGLAEVPGLVPEWIGHPKNVNKTCYPPETEYYRNWRIRGVVHGRGFLRYARQACDVSVVPVWVEGEEDLYDVWIPFPRIQRWLLSTWLRYPGLIFTRGRPWAWFWPKSNVPLRIWIGLPLNVSPTQCRTLRDAEDAFYDALDGLRNMAQTHDDDAGGASGDNVDE